MQFPARQESSVSAWLPVRIRLGTRLATRAVADLLKAQRGLCGRRAMEVKDAEVIPATADRDWGLVEALRQGEATAADWSTRLYDSAMQRELRDVWAAALEELPPHYRAAIVLRDVEGLSIAEVADALGIPVGTAKTRAHRARLFLRKRLSMFATSGGVPVEGVGSRGVPAMSELRNTAVAVRIRKVTAARHR